jgi:uncharacterized protein YkwD
MTGQVLTSTPLRLLRSWIGLLALVAIAVAPGTAHAVNVGPQGITPGTPFPPLQCPNGMFMLGVALNLSTHQTINAIRANCLAYDGSKGQYLSPPQFTAFSSALGGTLVQNGCAPGYYLSGIKIGVKLEGPDNLTFVEMGCTPLSGSGAAVTVCLHAGTTCSTTLPPFSTALVRAFTIACPGGQAAIGLIGNSSNGVTGLGLICGPKPGPGTQPPAATLSVPKATNVSSPATINQMIPGQVLAKDGCTAAAKAPPTQGPNDSPTVEGVLVCLINAERSARNLSTLTVDANLLSETIAEGHAAVTQKWWVTGANSHNNPQTGSTPDSRIMNSGYCGGSNKVNYRGEITYNASGTGPYYDDQGNQVNNSACLNGCGTPTAAVDWWMNISPPHRAVILTPGFTNIGVVAIGDVADPKAASSPAKGLYIVDFGSCQ